MLYSIYTRHLTLSFVNNDVYLKLIIVNRWVVTKLAMFKMAMNTFSTVGVCVMIVCVVYRIPHALSIKDMIIYFIKCLPSFYL